VYFKEWGNVELEKIVSHNLGDVVRPISEWSYIPKGSRKEFFQQMEPNFITHLKLIWHLMLIMLLFVLGIGLLQDVMNLMENVPWMHSIKLVALLASNCTCADYVCVVA